MNIVPGEHCPICYGRIDENAQSTPVLPSFGKRLDHDQLRDVYRETRTCPYCQQHLGVAAGPIPEGPPANLDRIL